MNVKEIFLCKGTLVCTVIACIDNQSELTRLFYY